MTVALLIPTINEIEGMKVIMPRIKREWVDEILFVDGGSTDGTIEYCKEHGYPLISQKERGARFAYNEAIAVIKSDNIILFSPDGNSIPEVIPSLVEKASEGYDMVIVSRYLAGAKSEDDGLLTGFGNKIFTFLINILYGGKYTDAMVMYRIWKKQIYYDLDLHKNESYEREEKMFGTIVGVEPLLSIRAAKRKLQIAEIPGDEPARIGGVAKLKPFKWGACYLYEVIREIFVWR
jgi:Glycosyltransferases involved in cell wall biogenesis